jgi:hypothetical protein
VKGIPMLRGLKKKVRQDLFFLGIFAFVSLIVVACAPKSSEIDPEVQNISNGEDLTGEGFALLQDVPYIQVNHSHVQAAMQTVLFSSYLIVNRDLNVDLRPISLTSIAPIKEWPNYPELRSLPLKEYIAGAPLEYYWHMDGTCGAYYRKGMILSERYVPRENCERAQPPKACFTPHTQSNQCTEYLRVKVANKKYYVPIDRSLPLTSCHKFVKNNTIKQCKF